MAGANAGAGRLRRNTVVMGATWALMAPFNSAVGAYSSLYFMELGAMNTRGASLYSARTTKKRVP